MCFKTSILFLFNCVIITDSKRSQLSSVKSSDNNSRLSDLMNDARSLFAGRKTKQTKVQKIKLSARAKELIKTSLLTAKARATNFVETEDGLKPAEEVARIKEEKAAIVITGNFSFNHFLHSSVHFFPRLFKYLFRIIANGTG